MRFRVSLRIAKNTPTGALGRIVHIPDLKSRRSTGNEIFRQYSATEVSDKVGKRGKGKQSTPHRTGAKPWWTCLIGALSFCLWGSNLLPIQHVEYKLVTNLAISQHRLPILQKLASQSELSHHSEAGKAPLPFSRIEILAEENQRSMSNTSELQSVRAKICCPIRSSIKEVERSLAELTSPSLQTDECESFENQLLQERWRLESCKHSLKRLELDADHDRSACETQVAGNPEPEAAGSPSPSPFRLSSFSGSERTEPSQSMLIENLQHLAQTHTENLESMNAMMERLRVKSRGFLSMTGSPVIEPMVRPLSRSRLAILFLLFAAVWFLLSLWATPHWSPLSAQRKRESNRKNASGLDRSATSSEQGASDFNRTIHWMQREGIPYLGEIHLAQSPLAQSHLSSDPLEVKQAGRSLVQETNDSDPTPSQKNLVLLRKLGEGSLVLWIGLFVARLLFDSSWRELAVIAPLASISRMVTGIQ